MDWNAVIIPIITSVASLIIGFFGAIKGVLPRIIEQRLTERDEEREAERTEREAKIREQAERAAYDRNRQATREDRTLEMLHDTLEWLKEQSEKDRTENERRIDHSQLQIEAINTLGRAVTQMRDSILNLSYGYGDLSKNMQTTQRQLQEIQYFIEQNGKSRP